MRVRTKRAVRAGAASTALVVLAMLVAGSPLVNAQRSDRAKQVGMKLMCMCGCGQVLVQCNHINCPSSGPMLKELDQHVASGEADDLIVQDFVQEYGVQVLSAPPNTGFNRVAWLMPGIAFAIGLGIVMVVIASWRHKARPASAVNIEVSSEARARAREAANRETED